MLDPDKVRALLDAGCPGAEIDLVDLTGTKDHYQARTIVRLKKKLSLNDAVRNPVALTSMGLRWLFANAGPLTVGAGQVGGAACTRHSQGGRPDVQFNVMPLSVDKPGDPLHSYSGFTAAVWQCHPASRGSVRDLRCRSAVGRGSRLRR